MGRGAVLSAVRKDGTESPVDIDLTPVGEDARPLVMAVVHDVTERIEAQRRFRRILESAPDGMLLVNRAGGIVIANGRAEALFGYGRGGLRGLEVDVLVPPADRERHRRGVERFFAEPRVMHLDGARSLHGLRRDSTTFPLEIDVGPLETQEAGVLAIVSVRDLTARRTAEREREALLHALQTERERLRRLSARLLEAQETERRAIARELHDQLGQALTAVTLDLQCLRRDVDPAQHAVIDGLVGSVRAIVSQARDLSLALRPSVLDDLGLAAAMRWYLLRQDHRGPQVGFVDEIRDLRVSSAVEIACFRITQEAVTNALRHAVARSVSVELRTGDGELQLIVSDDGVGFDVEAARARAVAGGSMGLLGMEERATLVGGHFAIETEPGAGTRVRACFPL
jgi:PAS domain S-box-containing protein